MRAMFGVTAGLAICLWANIGQAQVAADPGWTAPEAWAWTQIAAGRLADFDVSCQGAGPECRTLRGATIARFLVQPPWRDAIPPAGLRIVGAAIEGDVDLVNAHVVAAISLTRDRVAGSLWLARARLDGLLALDGTDIAGQIDAVGLQADSDVSLTDGRWLVPDPTLGQGTHARGPVSLQNARIKGSVFLNASAFDKDVDLSGAHVAGDVKTSGARFQQQLLGTAARVAGNLSINATGVAGAVKFPAASVGGLVDADASQFGRLNMMGARVAGDLNLVGLRAGGASAPTSDTLTGDVNLASLTLGGDLILADTDAPAPPSSAETDPCGTPAGRAPAIAGNFWLAGAAVGGATEMSGLAVNGAVDLTNARLGNALNMGQACLRKNLAMASLHVNGDLRLGGTHVAGETTAADLDVAHDLDLSHAVFEKSVNLFGARIGDTAHIEDSRFLADLVAPGLHSSSDLKLHGTDFRGIVDLDRTRLGGDLDLGAARFITLDLNQAEISGALMVDPGTSWDDKAGQLNLTHAHLGALQDAGGVAGEGCPKQGGPLDHNGWPTTGPPTTGLHLDGLTYDHLGQAAGQAGIDMRARDVCWWRWWLDQDETFSQQPYLQLAAVMAAHGDKGDADAIAYFGRRRETGLALAGGHYVRWLLLSLFNVTVGYGIGDYSLRAFGWCAGLIVIGALLLRNAEGAKAHSWAWRFGASMARVLPVIEINKEFSDFFDDPDRKRLTGRQTAIFSALAVLGWVLGLFILAAISGLTQHS